MPNYYTGQNADVNFISKRGGAVEIPFVENFSVEPSHNQKVLYFFNEQQGFTLSILDSAGGSLQFLQTEQKLVQCVLQDMPYDTAVIVDDPATYQPFHAYMNCRNNEGVLDMGVLIKRCTLANNPANMTPRDEQHMTASYRAATRYIVQGAGIMYKRILADTPAVGVRLNAKHDWNLPASPAVQELDFALESMPLPSEIKIGNKMQHYFYVLKNGEEAKSGFTFTATKFTVTDTVLDTDVWEIFYAFAPIP